uniref:phospholipid-hydroperoxide glutathione peroxidase n=1 Tax=Oreochromis aureus TaxID=47969 RepID=A0AAZ1XKH7_OREAU
MCKGTKCWLYRLNLLTHVRFPFFTSVQCAQVGDWRSAKSIYEFSAKDIDGNEVSLEKYRGYVCIIVNVLAEMHASYAEKGLRILGFPCNQFGGQEPGTEAEIKEFAKGYNAEFDLFSKIEVNGDNAHPLWKWMKAQPKGKGTLGNNIKWNFTKVTKLIQSELLLRCSSVLNAVFFFFFGGIVFVVVFNYNCI